MSETHKYVIIATKPLDCPTATKTEHYVRIEFDDFEESFNIFGNYLLSDYTSIHFWIDGSCIADAKGLKGLKE